MLIKIYISFRISEIHLINVNVNYLPLNMCPLRRDCDYLSELLLSDTDWSPSNRSITKSIERPLLSGTCCNCDGFQPPTQPKPLPSMHLELTACLPKKDFTKSGTSNYYKEHITNQQNRKFQSLCKQFDSTCLSEFRPIVTKLYSNILEHDKKILNCMIMKRIDDTVRMDYAHIARTYWEQEKCERELLTQRQHLEYDNLVKEKQKTEKIIRDHRRMNLAKKQQHYINFMKNEINTKKCRSNRRLEKVRLERKIMFSQREQERLRKHQLTSIAQEKNRIDEEIRNRECTAKLEDRITRADAIRNYYLDTYQRRLNEENVKHSIMQAANYDEIKQMEKINLNQLKQRLFERDRKQKQFELNKTQWMEESRDKARITATLRDIVRKSTSPENYTYHNYIHNHLSID